jgi:hypothetical protein
MSGSEIIDEWKGKRVSIKVAGRGPLLRGEVVRTDAVEVLFAVEEVLFLDRAREEGWEGLAADEDSIPMFFFVPWAGIETLIPNPHELP